MRKYNVSFPKQFKTLEAHPKASRQTELDMLLFNRMIRNISRPAIQGKSVTTTDSPLQKKPSEATIGEEDWEIKGRSDSRIIYNTEQKALGYWVRNEGSEVKIYDTNITLHHIIPVECLKKFWNKIKRNISKIQTLINNLVDINLEQRLNEIRELSGEVNDYHSGFTLAEREKVRKEIQQIESEIAEKDRQRQPLQKRMESIQAERNKLAQKRPSKAKVSINFERLKLEQAEVQKELEQEREEIKKLKFTKTLLLQQYNRLNRKIESFDRLKEQGIDDMPAKTFLLTKGTFSDLLGTSFTAGSYILTAEEVKQYINERTGKKNDDKDQIIASLYLWLPGNLVPGPKENTRPNDGHDGFDQEAAEIQGNQTEIKALYDKIYDYTDGKNSALISDKTERDIINDIQEILAKGKMNQNGMWIRHKNGEYVKE